MNQSGEVFLSHTKLDGRYVLRLAIGNLRTTARHTRAAWELLNRRGIELTRFSGNAMDRLSMTSTGIPLAPPTTQDQMFIC